MSIFSEIGTLELLNFNFPGQAVGVLQLKKKGVAIDYAID